MQACLLDFHLLPDRVHLPALPSATHLHYSLCPLIIRRRLAAAGVSNSISLVFPYS